jgi:hypothetical protein
VTPTRTIRTLVATLLIAAAACPGARAQDATPSDTPSANQSSPPPAASPDSGTQDSKDKDGKPVCFQLTGHCVEAGKKPQPKAAASGSKKPLNLSAPDVRTVVPAEELKEPLPSTDQITESQESDTVAVKGEAAAPDVPGGFGALWWALNHPGQAWRIVTPAE